MNTLLACKEKFVKIYQDFEVYFKVVAKFIFALLTLNSISNGLGYFDVLNLLSIRMFIAVVCAFIPVPMVVFVMAAVALLHLFKLSIVMAAFALVVFVIIYVLYLKFAPSHGIYMLAVAALVPFHLEFVIPLLSGLFFSPVTLIPVGLGLFTMKFLGSIAAAPEIGTEIEIDKVLAAYQSVVDSLMGNKEMMLYIVTFAAVIVLVYIVKSLPFDYSWYAAIAAGAVLNIIMLALGGNALGVDTELGSAVFGTVIGALIAAVVQFFKCTVDYKSKQYVQFEDDDYYYYVKAIPKTGHSDGRKPVQTENDASHEKHGFDFKGLKFPKRKDTSEEDWEKDIPEELSKDDIFRDTEPKTSVKDETKVFEESILPKQNTKTTQAPPHSDDDFGAFDDFDFSDYDDDESKF